MSGRVKTSLETRFWEKVTVRDPKQCWEWTGNKYTTGYGSFRVGKNMVGAHRVSYELAKGEIPRGLVIDHLCRNRSCVNPSHLEAVTHQENISRGARSFDLTGTCRKGHPIKGPDDFYQNGGGSRRCKRCVKANAKRYHERNREKRIEKMRLRRKRVEGGN